MHMEVVAKVLRSDLRNSTYAVIKKMAGKYSPMESRYKYITSRQARQLTEVGISIIYLTKDERVQFMKPKKVKTINHCKVTYSDDEGIHTIDFASTKDARSWVDNMEYQSRYDGENFELINII